MKEINLKDVLWNYLSTFLKIGFGVILLPFILRNLSHNEYAVWTLFASAGGIVVLLDFGFTPVFARNITYLISGAKTISSNGFIVNEKYDNIVDYEVLSSMLSAMRYFYFIIIALIIFVLMPSGIVYLKFALKGYNEIRYDIVCLWGLYVIVLAISFYTQYYDALMIGSSKIKESKSIQVVGMLGNMLMAVLFLVLGYGVLSLILGQLIYSIIVRVGSYKVLSKEYSDLWIIAKTKKNGIEILKLIAPNAIKTGLTSLGGFFANRSVLLVGALFLKSDNIASYGLTYQIAIILSSISGVYLNTYLPKLNASRIRGELDYVKKIYVRAIYVQIFVFVVLGGFVLLFSSSLMNIIGSKTNMLNWQLTLTLFVISFLESNHSMAGTIIMTGNIVPFHKASIAAGFSALILSILFLGYFKMGVIGVILAGGLSQIYNNWRWPYEAKKIFEKYSLNMIKKV
jgi:O-antigen/teichoic acid export membrane protein